MTLFLGDFTMPLRKCRCAPFLSILRLAGLFCTALGWAVEPGAAHAQTAADKPLKLIVPYAPGGSTDVSTRIAGQSLARELGTTVLRKQARRQHHHRHSIGGDGATVLVVGKATMTSNGVQLQSIPYPASAPSIAALLGGQTDVGFEVLSTALPPIRAGK